MDKQNYTLREIDAQAVKQYFTELEEELTQEVESHILKRKRVLKSLKDLIQAIYLYFAQHMSSKYGIVMSDTAWRKQILKAAPILWEEMKSCRKKRDSAIATVVMSLDILPSTP